MTTHSITGKTILIAGGAKNLGGQIARDLAKQGAKTIVIHHHNHTSAAAAQATAQAVELAGAKAFVFQADLTQPGAMADLFAKTMQAAGSLDIAINTIGKVLKKPIADTTDAEFDAMFAINTKVAFQFIREAGQHLSNNGKLLSIVTSLLGAYTPFYSTYAGAKAAVEHFTRAASKELGARGISVNAIGPGPMDTPFFYGQEEPEAVAYHKTAAALSGFSHTGLTDVEDIVPHVRFMVSDGWWMTGQTILVNGGYTTK
ncbi:MAG: SDR family oxidoreductase [Acetobacter syzygii]|uniref:SDR family oxidoreductase n=1 Tax=Acetobacter syzygii TaxID=146476 RepID=UPI00156F0B2C|nr:SDR family oxidoreductase [Acetobacter syzygii]NSL93699.1 SDR family oxidoreductase [Acetobacter syzygii]